MAFADQLKLLRNKKGLTQRVLAKTISVSPSAIVMWETGEREPDLETINKIAKFFNVPVGHLVDESDTKQSSIDLAEVIREKEVTYQGEPVDKKELRKALIKMNIGTAAHIEGELYDGDVDESLMDDIMAVIERAKKKREERNK